MHTSADKHAAHTNPLLPGYVFERALVARCADVQRDGALDCCWNRPAGLPGYLIVLTGAGAGQVDAGGVSFCTEAGQLLLISPAAAHQLRRADHIDHWCHQWVYFHPRGFWAPWLKWTSTVNGIGRIALPEGERREEFARMFAQIAAEHSTGRSTAEELATNLLERLLIRCHEESPDFTARHLDPRVRNACQFIASHLEKDLSLQEIARHICLSPSRLAHVFREQTGVNIVRWREDQRMLLAKHMLQAPGRPISTIAARVGYDDRLYFSRVFRKRVGVSPTQYRNDCEVTARISSLQGNLAR